MTKRERPSTSSLARKMKEIKAIGRPSDQPKAPLQALLRWGTALVLSVCGSLLSAPAQAVERGSWEIGMDLGAEFVSREVRDFTSFDFGFVTQEERSLEIPQASMRAAYFITSSFAIESNLGFAASVVDVPEERLVAWNTRVGLAAHIIAMPQARFSPFLSTGLSVQSFPFGVVGLTFGAARLGIPVLLGLRIGAGEAGLIRIQSGVTPTFSSDSKTATVIPIQVGWSWLIEPPRGGDAR